MHALNWKNSTKYILHTFLLQLEFSQNPVLHFQWIVGYPNPRGQQHLKIHSDKWNVWLSE